jgi:hypothetical protein
MDDLGYDPATVRLWFPHTRDVPYVLIHVSAEATGIWRESLPVLVRRCYLVDDAIVRNAARLGRPRAEIVASKLPDPGAVMSGDFGEIVAYLYQSGVSYPASAIGVKKWRLKQDRSKAIPYSDVIHFVLPDWPSASADDILMCSEVKSKATVSEWSPIPQALKDIEKDVTSRLAKTLVWLRERAQTEDLGDIQIAHLNRFINTSDYPLATRRFRAVAVVCDSVVDAELLTVPHPLPPDRTLIVIVVPQLKETYSIIFEAAATSIV